jgi:hypothetical protein
MSYLGRIEAKLDELVRAKKSEEAEKQPTQEEKDEERLREIEERMTDLIELLNTGTTRDSADAKIEEHRERVKSGKGEPRPLLKVYHEHKGKKIPTTRRTQSKLMLADALKMRIRVGKHAQDLEHALHILVKEQVEILERQLDRVGKKGSSKDD